jgi:hypothetical protein
VTVLALLTASACTEQQPSARDAIISAADPVCQRLTDRFTGDLAFGDTLDQADAPMLRTRVELLTALQDQVRSMAPPESKRTELDEWLRSLDQIKVQWTALGDFATSDDRQMQWADAAVNSTSAAAKAFGFTSCAEVAVAWLVFARK